VIISWIEKVVYILKSHPCACGTQQVVQRVRPVRVAARSQREMMAIIAYNNTDEAEWINEEYLGMTGKVF